MSNYCYPTLPFNKKGFTVQNGCGWLDPGYYEATGSEHTGVDFNYFKGGDSDLGMSVYAITDGIVEDVGFYRGWGNIVLIYHPGPNVWSQYAHLKDVNVKEGQRVNCRDIIGTIGKGAKNQFWAHLHFEIRYKTLPSNDWISAREPDREKAQAFIRANYVDPLKFLAKNGASAK